jgi:hypothetical protein
MLKTIATTFVTLFIAIIGGAGSVWLALDSDFEFDTVRIGNWVAFPERGTPQADPYSKARFSREADLALGHAEGLIFIARRDSEGERLQMKCNYRIEGNLPPSRFWTLHTRDEDNQVIVPASSRAPALHSLALLREVDNSIITTVSRHPSPGNWLALDSKSEAFSLILTLYDTATASSARIGDVELPLIVREGCDA